VLLRTIILEGVNADRWRILIGKDAGTIDGRVRRPQVHSAIDNITPDQAEAMSA
jgi:hypothetical protein